MLITYAAEFPLGALIKLPFEDNLLPAENVYVWDFVFG